jgi:hypothetical protein
VPVCLGGLLPHRQRHHPLLGPQMILQKGYG